MLSHRSTQPATNVLLSGLLATLAFVAPSNLFYRFDQFDWAVRGLRIDYLLGKFYLTDMLLLALVIAALLGGKKISLAFKKLWLIGVLTLLLLVRQIFTDFPIAAISQSLRLGLLLTAAWLIKEHWSHLKLNWVWLGIVFSHLFQAVIAFWQFVTQHSVGSYYWLLGEPNLSLSFGLSRGSFGNLGEKILPYGTTAHPNILAAWLVSSWLLLLVWWPHITLPKNWKLFLVALTGIGAGWGVIASQSITALGLWLHGIGYFLIIKFWRKTTFTTIKTLSLALGFCILLSPWIATLMSSQTSPAVQKLPSVSRRLYLQTAAEKIFVSQPWVGVGLNQFTANLEVMQRSLEPVRFDQPVHHVVWLWLTETGLLGLAWLVALYNTSASKQQNLTKIVTLTWLLFPSLIWDHYLLTQPIGLLIIWWWWLTLTAKPIKATIL